MYAGMDHNWMYQFSTLPANHKPMVNLGTNVQGSGLNCITDPVGANERRSIGWLMCRKHGQIKSASFFERNGSP